MLSAVGARHLSIGTLAFAGTNGALKDETRPPAYRMVAYADHGVVVFDRPDDTTKQHWPRHRARARVVYCSRPPNTHLTAPTSTHPPHSSDGTTSFKIPPPGPPHGGPFNLFITSVGKLLFTVQIKLNTPLTHSLTYSPCCALWRPDAHTRGLVRLRYDDRTGATVLACYVHDTFTNNFSRGHARRSSRRPNLHSGRWV